MAEFEKVRYQVNRCLCYQYPGDANDEDGSIDRTWINKKQKHEVDYAIAKCLCDCNAEALAIDTKFVQHLEAKIQNMNHDGMGRCERQKAYPALYEIIQRRQRLEKLSSLISK